MPGKVWEQMGLIMWALGLSQLMGGRGKCWKWLSIVPLWLVDKSRG